MALCVEIRSYELQAGAYAEFARQFRDEALPTLRRWGIDVVHAGPSLHEDDSFVVIRAYASVAARQASQDAHYGSAEWREGPREPILALIKSFTSAVIPLSAETLAALRADLATRSQHDGPMAIMGNELGHAIEPRVKPR